MRSFRGLDAEWNAAVGTAITDAAYAEYSESDPATRFAESQITLRLSRKDARELADRIWLLVDDFRRSHQSPDADALSVMWAFFEPCRQQSERSTD
jgi:hypothetical protein